MRPTSACPACCTPRSCGRRPTARSSRASTLPRPQQIDGVRVVKEGDLVAVLHEHPDVAEMALKKVKAEFDVPEANVGRNDDLRPSAESRAEGRALAKGGRSQGGRASSLRT